MQKIIFYFKLVALLCCIGILPFVFPILGWFLFQQGIVLLWVILGCIYIWRSINYEIKHSDISSLSERGYKNLTLVFLVCAVVWSTSFAILLAVYSVKNLMAAYYISPFIIYLVLSLVLSCVVTAQLHLIRTRVTWYRFMVPFIVPAFIVFGVFATHSIFYHVKQAPKAQVLLQAEQAAQSGHIEACEQYFLTWITMDKYFHPPVSEENREFAQRECERMKDN